MFDLEPGQLLEMAGEVIELSSHRRALLFLRAGQLGHFVSCLVYLPRDRYTTAVRLAMQDILIREFGGESVEYTAGVTESPWAVVYFTVKRPDGQAQALIDCTEANRLRVQELLTVAARTWADRLLGSAVVGQLGETVAEHYAEALPEEFKGAVTPAEAVNDITLIESLTPDSVRLQLEPGKSDREAFLTWYIGGSSASLSRLLPVLQSMGVEVLEERPFTVIRPDGLEVWIYEFVIRLDPSMPVSVLADWEPAAARFTATLTAVWQGRAEVDGLNELVLRAGFDCEQVAVLRAYAKYLRQAGFPYSQAHIEAVLNSNPGTSASLVALFEAVFDPDSVVNGRDAKAAARAVAADIDALTSLDTDRVLRAFASMIESTLRTNRFVTDPGSARAHDVLAFKLNPELIDELPLPAARCSRSSSTRRGSRACTCGSARSRAAACAGPTAARTSAPRSSAW